MKRLPKVRIIFHVVLNPIICSTVLTMFTEWIPPHSAMIYLLNISLKSLPMLDTVKLFISIFTYIELNQPIAINERLLLIDTNVLPEIRRAG